MSDAPHPLTAAEGGPADGAGPTGIVANPTRTSYPRFLPHAWRAAAGRQVTVVLAVFLLVMAFFSLGTDGFLRQQNLANLARTFSWLAIVSFGQSLVIMIGGIDLSVGATMALASLVAAQGMQLGLSMPLAGLAGLGVGMVVGSANGLMVARTRLPPFVVTMGTMSIARGLAFAFTRGWSVTNLPAAFLRFGQSDLTLGNWSIPLPFLIALATAIAVTAMMHQTVIGSYIFALSSGERALLISGVNVVRLKVLVYTFCGLLAALGGLILTARLGVAAPGAAFGYEIDVVAATVIGGTSVFGGISSTLGVLLGAAIIQMLYNGLVLLGLPAFWQTAAIGAMTLLAILLDYWRRSRGKTRGTLA